MIEEPTTPLRAALYARVSTRDKGQDPEVQLGPLREYAAYRGFEVVAEYVDHGYSGKQDRKRPKLDLLMEEAHEGKFDVVIVWRFDRFARSTKELLGALEVFNELGVSFISKREDIDTSTPGGELVFTIFAALGQFESRIIGERVKAGLDRAREQGRHPGRPRGELDLRGPLAMLREGATLQEAASAAGTSRRTLRRRLEEEGEWPVARS